MSTTADLTTWATGATSTPDLDPLFGVIDGRRSIAEAVARRWLMPRGSLWFDQDAGTDVRAALQARWTDARIKVFAIQLADEARKDERVDDAEVSISISVAGEMSIDCTILEATGGSFRFELEIGDVTAELLMENASA